jgi:hypothetical protein
MTLVAAIPEDSPDLTCQHRGTMQTFYPCALCGEWCHGCDTDPHKLDCPAALEREQRRCAWEQANKRKERNAARRRRYHERKTKGD